MIFYTFLHHVIIRSAPTACHWPACSWAFCSFLGELAVATTPPHTSCVQLAPEVGSRRCEPESGSTPTDFVPLSASGAAGLPAPPFLSALVGPHPPSGPQMVKWLSRPKRPKQTGPAEKRLKNNQTLVLLLDLISLWSYYGQTCSDISSMQHLQFLIQLSVLQHKFLQ